MLDNTTIRMLPSIEKYKKLLAPNQQPWDDICDDQKEEVQRVRRSTFGWDRCAPGRTRSLLRALLISRGIAISAACADEEWKIQAIESIRITAERLEFYSSDDVWKCFIERCGDEFAFSKAKSRSALGHCMRKAAELGYGRNDGLKTEGERDPHHGKTILLWTSLIFKGPQ